MPDLVIARTAQGGAVSGNPVVVGFDDIESQTVPGLITTGSRWTFTARNAGRYLVSVSVNLMLVGNPTVPNTGTLVLNKNGNPDASVITIGGGGPIIPPTCIHLSKCVSLAVSDTLQVLVSSTSLAQLTPTGVENWITIAELA